MVEVQVEAQSGSRGLTLELISRVDVCARTRVAHDTCGVPQGGAGLKSKRGLKKPCLLGPCAGLLNGPGHVIGCLKARGKSLAILGQ